MNGGPVLLTSGDPAGIGPEIAAKAWAAGARFVWLGDPRHLPDGTAWREISDLATPLAPGPLPVLRHDFAAPALPGQPVPANAAGVIQVIERAVALVMAGRARAVCTAPINKRALKDGAGFAFPGHTEFLAHLAGGPPPMTSPAGSPADSTVPVLTAFSHSPKPRPRTGCRRKAPSNAPAHWRASSS